MGLRLKALLLLALALAVPACGPGTQTKINAIASAPINLVVTPVATGRIDLAWTSTSTNEFEFRVERSDPPGNNFVQVGAASRGSQAYSDLGLLPGSTYYYRVSAWNSKGTSDYAGPASATTMALVWKSSTGGPGIRADHSAIYDSLGRRMILFGGVDDFFNICTDLWFLDLTSTTDAMTAPPVDRWSKATPGGLVLDPLMGHSAIYDAQNNRMIVFGGQSGPSPGDYRNDVYVLTLSPTPTWSKPAVSGTPPTGRAGHTAVYDAANQRMVVFGGINGSLEKADAFFLTLPLTPPFVWSNAPSGPLRRTEHSAIYDGLRQQMLLFAGLDNLMLPDGSDLNSETWSLSLSGTPTWTQRLFSGTPSMRQGHTAVYDSANQRMMMFGGDTTFSTGPTASNELWSLRLDRDSSWTFLGPSSGAPPAARYGQSAIYDSGSGRIVIFGGYDSSGFPTFPDTWLSDF